MLIRNDMRPLTKLQSEWFSNWVALKFLERTKKTVNRAGSTVRSGSLKGLRTVDIKSRTGGRQRLGRFANWDLR